MWMWKTDQIDRKGGRKKEKWEAGRRAAVWKAETVSSIQTMNWSLLLYLFSCVCLFLFVYYYCFSSL